MASTYSQNLKIELMGAGDQVGSWGNTTNDNLGIVLEEAMVGFASVQFTNDANLTLTLSNSNASQTSRKYYLRTTSTVTLSAQRDLIVPTIQKTYVVQNSTTGGQSIRVKTVSGTGIVVPNGRRALLYVDGVNVVEQVDYFSSLTVDSPSFTGIPTAPTAAPGTSTTQIATTAFVTTVAGSLGTMAIQNANNVNITGGTVQATFTGNVTGNLNGNLTAAAPTAPTAAAGTNTTQIATTAFVTTAAATRIPAGVIVMWSGSVASIPAGWLLCNGTSGTPDLRDRFVVGAGSIYTPGNTGGSSDAVVVSHTHTASTTNAGTHNHNIEVGSYGGGPLTGEVQGSLGGPIAYQTNTNKIFTAGDHNHAVTVNASGVSGTNANLPPYFALAYIMKS